MAAVPRRYELLGIRCRRRQWNSSHMRKCHIDPNVIVVVVMCIRVYTLWYVSAYPCVQLAGYTVRLHVVTRASPRLCTLSGPSSALCAEPSVRQPTRIRQENSRNSFV